MIPDTEGIDYSLIDQSQAISFIFYPRREVTPCPENAFDLFIPVDPDVSISCRLYKGNDQWPWILLFHGNGEVANDYDAFSAFYHKIGLNLAVSDYRGYGSSSGIPTINDMVKDSHVILKEVRRELYERKFKVNLWIMGRSLGSICALELAYKYPDFIKGLIVESGCSSIVRMIQHLGLPADGANLKEIDDRCVERIKRISTPSLLIHGEEDTIVPLHEAKALYDALGTAQKELIIIAGAGHNDLFFVGFRKYFEALKNFIEKTNRHE